MKNGTIVVGGNSGYMTGLYAFGGRIIVCGDIGPSAGESIIGARIYVGGSIASLGKNATVVPPTKKELREVQSLVRKAGLKPPRSFKKIVPLKKRFFKLDTGES
jgi:glutamate synthase domain-containing protein 3